ncbi:glycoside hydrolase family 43 protein [Spongiimicrobium sp. 3-5]|uniref:glycoside hydrolase family 43 protein n=1 Tax=Spongiimicrobium sp. 3-5 TaxID=3332596 RepID=UPI003980A739
MNCIQNPILPGFNPDPSICRVGDDYYIATSTFEWFPGVQIHHSKDLKHWKLIARPLSRISQLDMRGNPDSCGVWAPCLSYSNGLFYLVYSNVRSFDGVWKDTPNYLVTSNDISGEWSEPIYMSSRGFDGSLFHDDDGKKWYLNMLVDHRNGRFFGGIEMQEYSSEKRQLIGPVHYLTPGTKLGLTEGPHLYKKDGFYYIVLAEGGTEYGHAMSIGRSKSIFGPYEFHPDNPFVSAAEDKDNYLQKCGHGDLIQTQNGDWYAVFLIGRPLTLHGKCTLGRETAIETFIWKDGWPYLKSGSRVPRREVPTANLPEFTHGAQEHRLFFNNETVPLDFQALRIPITENWCSLSDRKGFLRLYGKESLNSLHYQSLLARRVQHFNVRVSTAIEFFPENIHHMAGLVFYYNSGHYHYACITANFDGTKKYLSIISSDNFEMSFQEELVDITNFDKIVLRGEMNRNRLQFFYSLDDISFNDLGIALDASILSDDHVRNGRSRYRPAFTGSFVGVCCQDLAMNAHHADFEWFEYVEIK